MLFVIICICNILGWYFTTEYSAQEVSCAFVILVTGSLPRKSLISRMDWVSCSGDINLLHDLHPTKTNSPDFEGPFRPSHQLSKSSACEKNQVL